MTFTFANHNGRTSRMLLTLVAVLAMAGSFVSPAVAQDDDPLKVVASFSILADWAGQVGGEHVDVTSIVPANGDAHTFDPDPATVASIADADVIFVIGPSFDGWMEDVIDSSGTDATVVVIMDSIDLTAANHDHESEEAHDDHEDEAATDDGHSHDHDGADPHIWGDASLVRSAVGVIGETLATADPDNAEAYQANADAYATELEELDAWIHEQVAMIPEENRKLVTSHDTFGYYADAYGFEIIGTALGSVSTESGDPSAADIATLVEQIKGAGVPAIFAENVVNPDLMQSIADETGVELAPPIYSDALGDADSGASTYIDMMRSNTTTIVDALSGE
jgi:zinc/manganese transport system substrate-binding protein